MTEFKLLGIDYPEEIIDYLVECRNYHKIEYQKYMKTITDKFINSLTYNSAQPIEEQHTPKYKRIGDKIVFESDDIYDECPTEMGGTIKRPKDVVEAWRKIQIEKSIKWLNDNMLSYDQWEIMKDMGC